MWQTGSATDYFDLLYQLRQVMTGRHVATAAVNAAGTGYTVGDVLTVVGGTSTHVATLEVVTITGGGGTGPVGTVRITNAGAYTSDPTPTTANGVTGGTGSSCTIDITVANTGWTEVMESRRALSAVVSAAGNGYNVGDEIEVQGGIGQGVSTNVEKAVFTVSTLTGGAGTGVATVTVKATEEGHYQGLPANPAATLIVTGSGDDACTLTVTYESRLPDDHSVLVLEGAAAGSPDPVQIGFWTYEGTISSLEVRNWGLFGFAQDYDVAALFHNQPGISGGLKITGDDGAMEPSTSLGSVNLPLKGDDGGGTYPLLFYMSVTDRRVMLAVYNETATIKNWVTAYMGFTNQFGTTDEIPYPCVIAGSASKTLTSSLDASTSPVTTSIVHMLSSDVNTLHGPAQMLNPAGTWQKLSNGYLNTSNAFSRTNEWNTVPGGYVNLINNTFRPGYAIIPAQTFDWTEMIDYAVSQTPEFELYPSPDTTATKLYVLVPVSVIVGTGAGNDPSHVWYPFGELDGLFWFSYTDAGAGIDALDYMDIGTDRYRVFRQGHRSEPAVDYFVFKEE